jgi:predicted permease
LDTFVFALNAVMPIALLVALGFYAKKIKLLNEQFCTAGNRLCFRILLPILLFMNIYKTKGIEEIQWDLAIYSCIVIFAVFIIGFFFVVPHFKITSQKGVILQCIFRSNFALIGLPLASSLAGQKGATVAAVLSLATIPLFNILAIFSLEYFGQDNERKTDYLKLVKGILKNPLIIAVMIGFLILLIRAQFVRLGISFRLSNIEFLYSALNTASSVASPLALIVLGAQFEFYVVRKLFKQIVVGTLMRILFVPVIGLGIAYLLFPQWGRAEFSGLIALFASPVAVSSSIMAAEMGGDKDLASQYVVWTTLLSAFTIFLFVFVFKAVGIL